VKKRIWELDAFRGLCIIGVVIVHLIYDLVDLYGIIKWDYPAWFAFVKDWGGIVFLILSGICVTLGSHNLCRGVIVFVCGMLCSAVTYGMYRMGFGMSIIIYFGVLHCLGVCMLLWSMYRHLPWWALLLQGLVLAMLGLYLDKLITAGDLILTDRWLMPLGLYWRGFASSDYFPLLPNLGFFLIGTALGKTVYKSRSSLLPKVNTNNVILRFLRFCGKHSLWIYLLHQPLISGICYLLTMS
jgi:uncharacterized membrane protein